MHDMNTQEEQNTTVAPAPEQEQPSTPSQQTEEQEGVTTIDGAAADQETVLEMAKAGVLYGHRKFRKNPQFADYVFTTRNSVEVIDLAKTLAAIDIVSNFLKKSVAEGKRFIIVATQPAAREAIAQLAKALGDVPYVTNKWIGGLLTNFPIISKRIHEYKRLKQGIESHGFDKHTKKERLEITREVERMEKKFGTSQNLEQVPDIMFVIDGSLRGHRTAIREAKRKGLVVVGIIDNDDNPNEFDYFVPANDHAQASVEWVVNRIIENISK